MGTFHFIPTESYPVPTFHRAPTLIMLLEQQNITIWWIPGARGHFWGRFEGVLGVIILPLRGIVPHFHHVFHFIL